MFEVKHETHIVVGVYQVCSNKSPGVKIGPALGSLMYIVKDFKKASLKNK
jgi:hypothetical protein